MAKHTIIYTRFTDPKQREESNEAQERKARQHLEYLGIDGSHAMVLKDSAQRGDLEDRACYDQLVRMIRNGQVAVLVVDQQSRFSRGFNVRAMIQDLVFHGGRFLTAAEGIDTDRPGWQDLVGIKEIHNQMEIRDTGWRVRRSQEQRIEKPSGSAGDYCYGYTSEFEDPAAAAQYRGRGPKPAKKVVIDPAATDVVREVFARFAAGNSIRSIVQWWEANKSSFPAITKSKIHHEHVRRLLTNKKFIGTWEYGRTTTVRNSDGKKKQVKPFAHQKVTSVQRPELRIISQELWDQAQARLLKLREIYGMRDSGKRRGPAQHYKLLYARRLLDGLVHCAECLAMNEPNTRLHVVGSNGVKRLGCPRHRLGTCAMKLRVPYAEAERAVYDVLEGVLLSYPPFIKNALHEMRATIADATTQAPAHLQTERRELSNLKSQISNLVRALAAGTDSPAIGQELSRLEQAKAVCLKRIENLEKAASVDLEIPDEEWIRRQLADLKALLKQQTQEGMQLMRGMIGRIVAEEVKAPDQRRAGVRIRFRIEGFAPLLQVMRGKLPAAVLDSLHPAGTGAGSSDEFVIDLGPQRKPQSTEGRRSMNAGARH